MDLTSEGTEECVHGYIFFQGNAGNIGNSLINLELLYSQLKWNIVIVGYRGYGHSQGSPSEEGLKQDAQSILDWTLARSDIDKTKIIVFGRSLGGAVAIDLCSKRQGDICGLIVENTFTNAFDFSENFIKDAYWMKKLLLMIDWPSVNSIQNIKTPILFISGRKDRVVRFELMDRLYEAASDTTFKRIFKVENGEHNDTWIKAGDDYWEEISTFVEKWFKTSFE